jgi:AcrR family transcriptional regulator
MPWNGGSESRSASEQTRRRLLDAGLDLFGRAGMHGVTTRALAEAAGVNLNAILYHFGGKEGLYMAVARGIVETTGAAIRSASTEHSPSAEALTAKDAQRVAGRIVSQIARIILGSPNASALSGFIIREQLQPTRAFDVLYEGFMGPVHVVLSTLVARVLGLPSSDRSAVLRAHGLLGEALMFGLGRETLVRRLGESTFSKERVEEIVESVNGQVIAALEGLQHAKGLPNATT